MREPAKYHDRLKSWGGANGSRSGSPAAIFVEVHRCVRFSDQFVDGPQRLHSRVVIGEPGFPADATRHDMLNATRAGDQVAIDLLREAGEGIGRFLGGFCNIFDPEVIVVGGEAVTFGDFLFEPMRNTLQRHAMWAPPPITPDWTDDSWARGAAALATQRLFDFEALSGATRVALA